MEGCIMIPITTVPTKRQTHQSSDLGYLTPSNSSKLLSVYFALRTLRFSLFNPCPRQMRAKKWLKKATKKDVIFYLPNSFSPGRSWELILFQDREGSFAKFIMLIHSILQVFSHPLFILSYSQISS